MKHNEHGSLIAQLLFVLLLAGVGLVFWQMYLSSHKQGTVYDAVVGLVQQQKPTATLSGVATRGPVTPVCRADMSCDAPITNHVVQALDESGTVAASAITDANGNYTLRVKPGTYSIVLSPRVGIGTSQDMHVSVHQGNNHLDIAVDTGIR